MDIILLNYYCFIILTEVRNRLYPSYILRQIFNDHSLFQNNYDEKNHKIKSCVRILSVCFTYSLYKKNEFIRTKIIKPKLKNWTIYWRFKRGKGSKENYVVKYIYIFLLHLSFIFYYILTYFRCIITVTILLKIFGSYTQHITNIYLSYY